MVLSNRAHTLHRRTKNKHNFKANYLSRERQLLFGERSGLCPPKRSEATRKALQQNLTKLFRVEELKKRSRESGQSSRAVPLSLPLSPPLPLPLSHPAAVARAAVREAATAASAPAASPTAATPPSFPFPGMGPFAAALVKPAPIPSPPLATDPWLQRTPSCSCVVPIIRRQKQRPGEIEVWAPAKGGGFHYLDT